MTGKPTYEALERQVKELEHENLELKKKSTIGATKFANIKIKSEVIPEEHLKNIDLQSLINVSKIQSIMDDFHCLTNMVTAVLDLNGNVLEATGWQDICTKFHRINPQTANNCTASDLYMSKSLKPGEFAEYKCKNGLWDVVTPLYVGTKHLGNIYTGQFFYDDDQVDEDCFIKQAEKYGFDKKSYLDALRRIPRYNRETISHLMSFLTKFTTYISRISLAKIQLKEAIREHTHTEQTLQKSEELYRLLADNATDNIWVLQLSDLHMLYTSPSVTQLLGYSSEEITGMSLSGYLTPESFEKMSIEISKELKKEGQKNVDPDRSSVLQIEQVKKDKSKIWTEVTVRFLRDKNGQADRILGIARDLTERKNLQKQLVQAQKMESIGTLAGGIAHDFNNILSAILGFTELAIDRMDKDSDIYDDLKEVMSAGNRAKELVQQILSFSRQTEHEMKPFDISDLVNEVHKMLRSTIPSSIAIYVGNQAKNTTISGDFTQLHQVLLNLCTNASHAMENEGGSLEIGLRNLSFDKEDKDLLPGDYVQLTISDTGIGIAPEIINQIFEPYFTTKEVGKGTGMGLAVVHGIIKSHNGNVTVYSEPGKGTTFNVYLPVVKEAGRDVSVQPKKKIATGDERILFVDDEPSIVKLQQQSLERLGYRVVTKTASMEALETFKAAPDEFDLVITDMTMPNMNGDRLAKEIKKIRPDVPVILCTGFSGKIKLTPHGNEKFQIDKLLMKPVDRAELSRTIREIVDKAKSDVQ